MAHQTLFQRFSDSIVDRLILRWLPDFIRPNHLTALRIIMTPLVVWSVLSERYPLSTLIFLIAAITDLMDGAMARTRDQITELGKLLDPIADKLLIGSLMVPLVAVNASVGVATTILLIEILFLVGGFIRKRNGQEVQANWWGKIKFNFQVLGILLIFLGVILERPELINPGSIITFAIAIGFGIVSLATHGF